MAFCIWTVCSKRHFFSSSLQCSYSVILDPQRSFFYFFLPFSPCKQLPCSCHRINAFLYYYVTLLSLVCDDLVFKESSCSSWIPSISAKFCFETENTKFDWFLASWLLSIYCNNNSANMLYYTFHPATPSVRYLDKLQDWKRFPKLLKTEAWKRTEFDFLICLETVTVSLMIPLRAKEMSGDTLDL